MFERSLEKIRERPEHEKRRIALVWSVVITVFVAVVWFLNLSFILPDKEKAQAVLAAPRGEGAEADKARASFLSKIKEVPGYFSDALDSVAVGAGAFKEEIKRYIK